MWRGCARSWKTIRSGPNTSRRFAAKATASPLETTSNRRHPYASVKSKFAMRMRKPLALALLAFVLAGCAHRHRRTSRTIPPPPPGIPQLGATETGIASWYGHPYHGRPAADGEIYDMETLVAAHRTLPFNTWVRVVNLTNDKSVEVRIIDRGPFINGRIIDLSHAAAT